MKWWRAYESALDDPKVQKLPGELFKAWFNLLCLASRGEGRLPSVADIAFALRKPEDETAQILADLKARGLIDEEAKGLTPHNWSGRQYQSDDAAARMKRLRVRRRYVTGDGRVTSSESESDSETETESETDADSGERVPAGQAMAVTERWQPSEVALGRLRKGRPDLVGPLYEQRLQEFRLWCRANAVASHDPEATWMGFMLKTRASPAQSATGWRAERAGEIERAIASRRFEA